MKHISTLLALTLTLVSAAVSGQSTPDSHVDTKSEAPKPANIHTPPEDTRPLRTFILQTGSSANDANDVLTAIRVMVDPEVRVFLSPSANAISVRATPTQLQLIEKLLSEINQPRKQYRLTYTLTELDAGKRIGVQSFAVIVAAGGRTSLKDGSKIPIVTGTLSKDSKDPETQFNYLDIGLNIDASLDDFANGARLRTKVEQSSAAEEKTISGINEPLIRQSVLEGTSFLTPGKPVSLGSFDIPGSTRHLDVSVVMEPAV